MASHRSQPMLADLRKGYRATRRGRDKQKADAARAQSNWTRTGKIGRSVGDISESAWQQGPSRFASSPHWGWFRGTSCFQVLFDRLKKQLSGEGLARCHDWARFQPVHGELALRSIPVLGNVQSRRVFSLKSTVGRQ